LPCRADFASTLDAPTELAEVLSSSLRSVESLAQPPSLEALDNIFQQINAAIRIAPFVVIPADQFEESGVQSDPGTSIENAGMAVVEKISLDDLVGRISEDAFQLGLAGLLHLVADFL